MTEETLPTAATASHRAVPVNGSNLIKLYETCVLRVYDDKQPHVIITDASQVKGVLTGGYGHTGPDVKIGMTVDQTLADSWFDSDLYEKVILPIYKKLPVKVIGDLTDNQYGALASFVFNLGTGDPRKPEWTIWKMLRAEQFDQVPLQFAKFVNWDGQKSLGLVRRRNAEIELWSTAEPGSADTNPPSSVTRTSPTPPTAGDPVPPQRSATIITGIAGAVAAGPPLINQAMAAIQPYSDSSDFGKHMLGILATAGAVLAVAAIGFELWQKHLHRN